MFDIGWSELMVIGVVSLIVVGPKDLPGMFHSLGRITAKARSMAREFSRAMEDAADTAGIKDAAKDFKDLTSKKSLGLDKLEQVASNFEKWEPKLPSGLKAPAGPPSLQPDPDAPPPAMPSIEDEAAEDAAEAALGAPKPARKAAPRKAAQAAAQRAADPVASNLIIDVTTSSFEADVITQSMTVPVVVDLWATWCEPCKQLSPILEKLVLEYDGRWILAKVDVDAEQQIAAAFQVQSIPTVYVVIGGQVAPMFQGAMPESQVRQVLEAVLAEAEKAGITGRVGLADGTADESQNQNQTLQPPSDPRFDAAEAALEAGDWAKAAEAYKEILSVTPGDAIAKIGLLNVNLLQRTDGRDLATDVETMTLETDSVLRAADSTFLMGEFADAFALLIEHLKNVTGTERDQTRERVLELFDIAGPTDPAVVKARIALTNALF